MIYDTIIVGGGAAGLFCAASHPVRTKGLILEKTNMAGTKLLMSGSGQCNFTHSGNIKEFLSRYSQNGAKLRSVLYPFNNLAAIEYFRGRGVKIKIREDGKVFPESLRAQDILNVLMREASKKGFDISYETPVTDIRRDEGGYAVFSEKAKFMAKKLVIATGGCSYPLTGSDGSMFQILRSMGIEINELRPSLVPIFVQQYPYASLTGIAFENVKVTIKDGNRGMPAASAQTSQAGQTSQTSQASQASQASQTSPLLFTHDSFSGPAILNMSRYARAGATLSINYFPDQDAAELAKELRARAAGSKAQAETVLADALGIPKRFAACVCERLSIGGNAASLSGQQMKSIISILTDDTFSISGTGGFKAAMATSGGVLLDEVDLKTLECKKYPRMHIIGEALDVDGDTGGYNIQFAFSSGHAAAIYAI